MSHEHQALDILIMTRDIDCVDDVAEQSEQQLCLLTTKHAKYDSHLDTLLVDEEFPRTGTWLLLRLLYNNYSNK